MSDFGISMITSASDINPITKEYQSIHYCGQDIFQTGQFDETRKGSDTAKYSSKFDVMFYGIVLWTLLNG